MHKPLKKNLLFLLAAALLGALTGFLSLAINDAYRADYLEEYQARYQDYVDSGRSAAARRELMKHREIYEQARNNDVNAAERILAKQNLQSALALAVVVLGVWQGWKAVAQGLPLAGSALIAFSASGLAMTWTTVTPTEGIAVPTDSLPIIYGMTAFALAWVVSKTQKAFRGRND